MPNSKHLTHGISNLVSLITKTKLGLSTATTVSYTIMPRHFGGELFMVSHDSVAPKGETSAQQGAREGRNTDYVRRHREKADVAAAAAAQGDLDNVAGNR
jgi:hypothetical protein